MNRIFYHFTVVMVLASFIFVGSQTDMFAATGKVKVKETHQTMEGFGASIAWYGDWLTNHPNKEDLYYYIFNDLGLDILRLRNAYRDNPDNFAPDIAEIVEQLYAYSDNTPKIMISSWSPPYNLKSNNSVNGGSNATLKKDPITGKYMYTAFAKYWVDALNTYKLIGIEPDYISIQNEPSFDASWESCRFNETENAAIAGYDRALDSVYYALQQANLSPKILGPEVHGIGYNTFQNYAQKYNHSLLDGYAYHLYHGESKNDDQRINPDLFITNLSAIAANYQDKPIFQTEYDRGDWFYTVRLMHDCLVNGNVSAYLWWELVWDVNGGKPLVGLENPWDPSGWSTDQGFILTPFYWAFRQYSKFINSGWKRVTTELDVDSLRMSAFINPEENGLTLVILNIGKTSRAISPDIQDFNITDGQVIRTSETEQGEEIDGHYDGKSELEFPARSITTLSFSGDIINTVETGSFNPSDFLLYQNYPNPFNATTRIAFSIASNSYVQLKICDILGREIKTLVNGRMPAGKYFTSFDANDMNSGIYLYKIKADDFAQTLKMILLK